MNSFNLESDNTLFFPASNIGQKLAYMVTGLGNQERTELQRRTRRLEQDVFRMGALVVKSFHLSHQALFSRKLEAAQEIPILDQQIDWYYRKIERDCAALIVLQVPVGESRRFCAFMQLVRDLERIGDYAENLGEFAIKLFPYSPHPCMSQIKEMSYKAQAMLEKSLVALGELDVADGRHVKQMDNAVDTDYEMVYQTLASQRDVPGVVEPILLLELIIRHLERMADHATNIGQRVAYIVTGYRSPDQRQLQQKSKRIEQDVLRMGALVEKSFRLSQQALFSHNLVAAREIAVLDKEIDRYYRQIELYCCTALMTLQAPIAKELRRFCALMQLVRDLERIGDYAEDLGEMAIKLFLYPPHACMPQIEVMSRHAQAMLDSSLDALADLDAAAGLQVQQLDDAVDTAYEQVYRILAYQQNVSGVMEPILLLGLVIRHLERMADHATNIGQRVAYIVTGNHQVYGSKSFPQLQ